MDHQLKRSFTPSDIINDASPPVKIWRCSNCQEDVQACKTAAHCNSLAHKSSSRIKHNDNVEIVESAFKNRIITYRVLTKKWQQSFEDFFNENRPLLKSLIENVLQEHTTIKMNVEAFGTYVLPKIDADIEIKSFNTRNVIVGKTTNLDELLEDYFTKIYQKSEEFLERDSGWTLVEVLFVELNINKYVPLRGSSYIELPKSIIKKKACINVKNLDDTCFAYAVISALYPAKYHQHRPGSYPKPKNTTINFREITFPVELEDIPVFENTNPTISINVYGLNEKDEVIVLHLTKERKEKHVNLLYLQDGEKEHYCWIKDLARLVNSQYSKRLNRMEICDGCLLFFRTKEILNDHNKNGCQHIRTIIPEGEKSVLKFKNLHRQFKIPFSVYADFECILQPISTVYPNPDASFTVDLQNHVPFNTAYFIKCDYNEEFNKYQPYRGKDCIRTFLNSLKEDARWIYSRFKEDNYPMIPLTVEQQLEFKTAQNCGLCGEPFINGEKKGPRVADHDHFKGFYRCAAHQSCNLQFKNPKFIPIFFHNLSRYDAHFLVKEMGVEEDKINVIANNKETYISFSIYLKMEDGYNLELRFLDSLRFMSSSLDALAENLTDEQMQLLKDTFQENFSFVKEKGIFPYDYIDSLERLNETKLPSQEEFFNSLVDKHCSDVDYLRAQNIWSAFKINTLGEYSDLYLKVDTFLLACVFENFRDVCLANYGLDPAHYYTSPGLSWEAALKITGIELDLLQDIDQITFIQRGIRGGISQVSSKRYAEANNKYLPNYDPSKPSNFIPYIDANNLYGYSMCQPLPFKHFRWIPTDSVDVLQIADDSSKGYILEVDLEYPKELHDLHSDLPFCPESKVPPNSKQKKLLTTLDDKLNYVIHYRNLKQAVANGLKLKKIHRVLEFSQSPWLQKYIIINNEKRAKAETDFEKDFYKLLNNCIYGKSLESVEKRKDIRLLSTWKNVKQKMGANDFIRKPYFHSSVVINENLVVIQMKRSKVVYNRPLYLGFCILELSKLHMYNMHYANMKQQYKNNISLLYTDTDSLIYDIQTDDLYADIKKNVEKGAELSWYDTSNYEENNRHGIPLINKKVLGKFKDENDGRQIIKFIALKSKSYCIVDERDKEHKRLKGVQMCVTRSKVQFDDFTTSLLEKKTLYRTMRVFRSTRHELFTQLANKVILNADDDKRFLIPPDNIYTLPWGHYKIPSYMNSV